MTRTSRERADRNVRDASGVVHATWTPETATRFGNTSCGERFSDEIDDTINLDTETVVAAVECTDEPVNCIACVDRVINAGGRP